MIQEENVAWFSDVRGHSRPLPYPLRERRERGCERPWTSEKCNQKQTWSLVNSDWPKLIMTSMTCQLTFKFGESRQLVQRMCSFHFLSFFCLRVKKEQLITSYRLYHINHIKPESYTITRNSSIYPQKSSKRLQKWSLMSDISGGPISSFQKANLPKNCAARYSNKLTKYWLTEGDVPFCTLEGLTAIKALQRPYKLFLSQIVGGTMGAWNTLEIIK